MIRISGSVTVAAAKASPDHHARRIGLDGLVDVAADRGKVGNLLEQFVDRGPGQVPDGAIDVRTFSRPVNCGSNPAAEFQQGGDLPVDLH